MSFDHSNSQSNARKYPEIPGGVSNPCYRKGQQVRFDDSYFKVSSLEQLVESFKVLKLHDVFLYLRPHTERSKKQKSSTAGMRKLIMMPRMQSNVAIYTGALITVMVFPGPNLSITIKVIAKEA